MSIKERLDAIAQATGSAKDVDIGVLVRVHSEMEGIATWAQGASQVKVHRAARAMAQILEQTILQSGPDIQAALDILYPTLEGIRAICIGGQNPAKVRFPAALSLVSKSRRQAKKDELEGTLTVFRPPKFLNDSDSRFSEFVVSARELLTSTDVQLLALESSPRDQDMIDAATRSFGMLDAAAEQIGLEEISDYIGATKTMIEASVEQYGELTPVANDAAFDAVENIRALIDNIEKSLKQGTPLSREAMLPVWIEELKIALQSKGDLLQGVDYAPEKASKKLGEILIDSGVISKERLEAALRQQKDAPAQKKFVGDILVDEAKVSRSILKNALEIQQADPSLGKVGDILIEMGAVETSDVDSALKKQNSPEKPKLGEVLVRSGHASAKGVAQTVRKQSTLRDLIRYGMSTLAGIVGAGGGEGGVSDAGEKKPPKKKPSAEEKKYIEADAKLTSDFIARSREHLKSAEVNLIALQSDVNDKDSLDTLYRAFHGIQRTAAFLGLDDIKLLSGEAEYVVDRVRKGKINFSDPAIDLMFDAIDSLELHIGFIETALKTEEAIETDPELKKTVARLRAAALGRVERIERKRVAKPVKPEAPKKLGELLIESGATTAEGLESALKLQQEPIAPLKLGDILVQQAKISRAQLEEALRIQREDPGRGKLGDILVQLGYVDPEDIDPALLTQQTPRKLLLGEALVKSGAASARQVAQALRKQKTIALLMRAGATAAVISGSFMYDDVASAEAMVGAGSTSVTIEMGQQLDSDNDGLLDTVETSLGTAADSFDTDGDGIDDAYEVFHGMDPKNADDAAEDFDGDRLTNLEEFQMQADPHITDTDGDGFWDGLEADRGTDPSSGDSTPHSGLAGDVNADGRVDAVDIQNVINAALGQETEAPADVDKVGDVNALDVQKVINAATGNNK
jgi:chemotaxis protein histidine kinase CheA